MYTALPVYRNEWPLINSTKANAHDMHHALQYMFEGSSIPSYVFDSIQNQLKSELGKITHASKSDFAVAACIKLKELIEAAQSITLADVVGADVGNNLLNPTGIDTQFMSAARYYVGVLATQIDYQTPVFTSNDARGELYNNGYVVATEQMVTQQSMTAQQRISMLQDLVTFLEGSTDSGVDLHTEAAEVVRYQWYAGATTKQQEVHDQAHYGFYSSQGYQNSSKKNS